MTAAVRHPPIAVPAFRPDGSAMDLANVLVDDIDFAAMAAGLSKMARFNAIYRCPAYAVGQHSVMGADALFNETGDTVLAGYFLLHDGHEYLTGDGTRPMVDRIQLQIMRIAAQAKLTSSAMKFLDKLAHRAIGEVKREIDIQIFKAAGIPDLELMPIYARQVKDMDNRMLVAEAKALFGPQAAVECLPSGDLRPPRLTGAIKPWGPMKAEEAFVDRLERYLGIVARV